MFMTEVLGRCSLLEQRVADIYSQFAGSLNDDKALESYWLGMAEEEKHHGKILGHVLKLLRARVRRECQIRSDSQRDQSRCHA